MTDNRVRPPGVSLCELMLHGLITEDDVLPGGKVAEQTRLQAEVQYAAFMATSQATAHPRRTVNTVRPHTARGFHTQTAEARTRPQTARGEIRTQGRPLLSRPIPLHRPRPRPVSLTPPPNVSQSIGDRACCICREKEKTHAIAPCFHMCVCSVCSTRISSCPLCRGPLISTHRIYL